MDQLSLFDLGVKDTNINQTSEKFIKASEMSVIDIHSFFYTMKLWYYEERNHWHVIFSTVVLLEDNMVYIKDFMVYPFLYKFDSYKKAYEFYYKKLDDFRNSGRRNNDIYKEINIHHELEDMYLCEKNKYGCFQYWNDNYNPNYSVLDRYKDK